MFKYLQVYEFPKSESYHCCYTTVAKQAGHLHEQRVRLSAQILAVMEAPLNMQLICRNIEISIGCK